MTIVATAKIQLNAIVSSALATTEVGAGELVPMKDAPRLVLGASREQGNPYADRAEFPFEHIEVLTEATPRNKELFSLNARQQGIRSFYHPSVLSDTAIPEIVTFVEYDGGIDNHLFLDGDNVSATIEYHAYDTIEVFEPNVVYNPETQQFQFSATTFKAVVPLHSGTVRILASVAAQTISDTATSDYPSNGLTFTVEPVLGGGYNVMATKVGTARVALYIRKTVISFSA